MANHFMLMQCNYTECSTNALEFQQDFELEKKRVSTDCKAATASISDNGLGLRVFRVSVM